MRDADDTIGQLFAQCRRDHQISINGDSSVYEIPVDGIIMPACGGVGRGTPMTAELRRLGSALWESGTGRVELIDGGMSGDIAWLVMVEQSEVKFMGRNSPARWAVRVTELFRRNPSGWERFHRHADPLVDGHTLDEVLELLT